MHVCFLTLFTSVLFVVLKLAGGLDWSWGFVLLPLAALVGAWWREEEIQRALKRELSKGCPRPCCRPLLEKKR